MGLGLSVEMGVRVGFAVEGSRKMCYPLPLSIARSFSLLSSAIGNARSVGDYPRAEAPNVTL